MNVKKLSQLAGEWLEADGALSQAKAALADAEKGKKDSQGKLDVVTDKIRGLVKTGDYVITTPAGAVAIAARPGQVVDVRRIEILSGEAPAPETPDEE